MGSVLNEGLVGRSPNTVMVSRTPDSANTGADGRQALNNTAALVKCFHTIAPIQFGAIKRGICAFNRVINIAIIVIKHFYP